MNFLILRAMVKNYISRCVSVRNNNCYLELDELTFFIRNNMSDRFKPIPDKGKMKLEQKTLPTLIFAENH